MTRFWGWYERFAVVFVLLLIVTVQVLLASEVHADAPPATTEPLEVVFHIVGLFVLYLMASIGLGFLSSVVSAVGRFSEKQIKAADNALCGVGAAFLGYSAYTMELDFTANPDLATTVQIFGGVLALKFVLDSIPFWYVSERWDPVGSVRGVVGR